MYIALCILFVVQSILTIFLLNWKCQEVSDHSKHIDNLLIYTEALGGQINKLINKVEKIEQKIAK